MNVNFIPKDSAVKCVLILRDLTTVNVERDIVYLDHPSVKVDGIHSHVPIVSMVHSLSRY